MDAFVIRSGRRHQSGIADDNYVLFPRFSAELVITALKDTQNDLLWCAHEHGNLFCYGKRESPDVKALPQAQLDSSRMTRFPPITSGLENRARPYPATQSQSLTPLIGAVVRVKVGSMDAFMHRFMHQLSGLILTFCLLLQGVFPAASQPQALGEQEVQHPASHLKSRLLGWRSDQANPSPAGKCSFV
jgi:hypothetical protein